jgi:hypothetical protein
MITSIDIILQHPVALFTHSIFESTTRNRREYNPPTKTHMRIEGSFILTTKATKQKAAVSSPNNYEHISRNMYCKTFEVNNF